MEYQFFCRRQARQVPNCLALEGTNLSGEVFSDGVAASGSSLEFQIKRGLRLT